MAWMASLDQEEILAQKEVMAFLDLQDQQAKMASLDQRETLVCLGCRAWMVLRVPLVDLAARESQDRKETLVSASQVPQAGTAFPGVMV